MVSYEYRQILLLQDAVVYMAASLLAIDYEISRIDN